MGMHSEDEARDLPPVGKVTVEASNEDIEKAIGYLSSALSIEQLQYIFLELPPLIKNSPRVVETKNKMKINLSETI
jgi:hypothetical protein